MEGRADFYTVIHKEKIPTLWVTGAIKSVMSSASFDELGCIEKSHTSTGIQLSSAHGTKCESIGQVTLNLKLGTLQAEHTFVVSEYLTQYLILGLDFHHKFWMGTDLDKDGKLFLHKNGNLVVHVRLSTSIFNIQSIKYKDISPYTMAIIQTTSKNPTQLETKNYYILNVNPHLLITIQI